MSELFDALRRGRPREPVAPSMGRAASADAVLATLGCREAPRRSFVPLLLAVSAAGLVALGAWSGWSRASEGATVNPSRAPAGPPAAGTPISVSAVPVEDRQARAAAENGRIEAESPAPADPSAAGRAPVRPLAGAVRGIPVQEAASVRQEGPSAGQPAESFRLAVQYQRAGDLARAQAQYRALLERNERDPRIHNNLGLLYREQGMLELAVREFQRALIIDPGYRTARNNLGVALLAQSRLEEAADEFRRVLAREPRNLDAAINLALVHRAAGRLETAKEALLQTLMIQPGSAPAHFNLAGVYEQTGEPARAVEHYRRFLEHADRDHAPRAADARSRIEVLTGAR